MRGNECFERKGLEKDIFLRRGVVLFKCYFGIGDFWDLRR